MNLIVTKGYGGSDIAETLAITRGSQADSQ